MAQGLRLALVGLTTEGQVNYDNQLEIKDPSLTKGYLMELPGGQRGELSGGGLPGRRQ